MNYLAVNFKIIKYHFHFSLWFKIAEEDGHYLNEVISSSFHYFLRRFQSFRIAPSKDFDLLSRHILDILKRSNVKILRVFGVGDRLMCFVTYVCFLGWLKCASIKNALRHGYISSSRYFYVKLYSNTFWYDPSAVLRNLDISKTPQICFIFCHLEWLARINSLVFGWNYLDIIKWPFTLETSHVSACKQMR